MSKEGEFNKRLAFLYEIKIKDLTFKKLSDIPKMIEEAKKEIYDILYDPSISIGDYPSRIEECVEKWFGGTTK